MSQKMKASADTWTFIIDYLNKEAMNPKLDLNVRKRLAMAAAEIELAEPMVRQLTLHNIEVGVSGKYEFATITGRYAYLNGVPCNVIAKMRTRMRCSYELNGKQHTIIIYPNHIKEV